MPVRPSISVIIPCYNVAEFLSRAVDSAIAQTFQPLEIVLIDDGSTDATPSLARTMTERHPDFIRYIRQDNQGLSGARNTGIREARGEWIALLDADDWWKPEKLSKQVALLDADPQPDLVYTALEVHSGADTWIEWQSLADVERGLRWANRITPSSVLVRRSPLLDVGGFDARLRAAEDWELWMRLRIKKKIRIATLSEPLTCYRRSGDNMSSAIDRMIDAECMALDSTLVSDLTGIDARCWRQRILSAIYYRAALNARDTGDSRELAFSWRAVAAWPSPFFFRGRWLTLAATLRKRLLGRRQSVDSPGRRRKD